MEKEVRKYLIIAIIVVIAIGILFLVSNKFTGNILTGWVTYGIKGAPSVSSVNINPENPESEDNLVGSIDASDGEGDDITYWYSWYKDEELNATTLIDNNLISYFPFDNDVLDYYGDNDGTNNGASQTIGKLSGAYSFDGSDDTIIIDASSSLDISPVSIGIWFYANNCPTQASPENYDALIWIDSDSGGYHRGIWGDSNCQIYLQPGAGVGAAQQTSVEYSTDQWNYIVVNYYQSGSDVIHELYINGILEDNHTYDSTTMWSDAGNYKIGSDQNGRYFDGVIDEVVIFNKILSEEEIQQLYLGGIYGNTVDSSYTENGDEWELKGRAGDSSGWSDEDNSGTREISSDSNSPEISFSSSTTSEGEHNQDWINIGVDLNDESEIYSFIDFNNSLNAFYKMNDTGATLKDYSSNSYDGTISGADSLAGKFGNALYFNGLATAVDCAGAGDFERTDNFSISIWVNGTANEDGIIQRYDGTKGWALYVTSAGALIFDLRHNSSDYIRRRSTGSVQGDVLHHIVCTYDGSSTLAGTHVYIDGELSDSSSNNIDNLNDGSISTTTNCKMGILHTYNNYRWTGIIDEALIFNRVLSSEEISALYNASSYSYNFTSLEDGEYNFYAYAQDTYGNEDQTSIRSVSLVSNVAPTISLILPEDTLYTDNESLALNFTVSDDNDAIGNLTCWYNLDGGSNISIGNCENTTFNTSDEATHTLNIFVNDSEGLEASDNVNFDVDSIGVSVSITQPSGTKTSRTSIPLGYTTNGNNLTCWYNVKTSIGGGVIDNTTLSNCTDTTFAVSNDGDYILNLFANNTFGSSGSDNSSFTIDTDSGGNGGSGGSGGSSRTVVQPTNLTTEITISEILDLIVNPGDTKKITWKVKNTGTSFLNDCKLEAMGQYSSWIDIIGIKDLAAGEEYEFIFTLNIPEDVEVGKYNLGILLNCQETNKGIEFIAEVLEKKLNLEIKEVVKDEDILRIIYSLEELSGIDQNVDLQFLLFNENEEKVIEFMDNVSIGADLKDDHSADILIDPSLEGEFKLLININSNIYSGVVEEELVLGKSSISGFTIFGESQKIDNVIAFVLIIGFLIFAFFIIKHIIKSRKK